MLIDVLHQLMLLQNLKTVVELPSYFLVRCIEPNNFLLGVFEESVVFCQLLLVLIHLLVQQQQLLCEFRGFELCVVELILQL